MVSDEKIFNDYIPYVNILEEYEKKLPVYFYDGDAKNMVIMRVLPNNKIIFLTDSTTVEESDISKKIDKEKIDKFLYTYLAETSVPEEGLSFLVDSSDGSVVYDFDDMVILSWTRVGALPPKDITVELLFYEDKQRNLLPIRLGGALGRDTALYLRYHTPRLFAITSLYPYVGKDLISDLYSKYYSMNELFPNYKTWAIIPEKKKSVYSEEQLKAVNSFKNKVKTKSSESNQLAPAYEDRLFPTKMVNLSWIKENNRIPYLYSYTSVYLDICLGESDKCIMRAHCIGGKLYFTVNNIDLFNEVEVCNTLGIKPINISVIEDYKNY